MIFLEWVAIILGAVVFAELFSGAVHWWEDRYGNPDWPIIGRWIVAPNIAHHQKPSALCENSYLNRNITVLLPCAVGFALAYWLGSIWLMLGFAIMSQSNEVHSWAHQRRGPVIRFFQRLGVLQSPQHHKIHHTRPFDRYYCVMTNYLNPVLHRLRFWQRLEWIVWLTLGAVPRSEREVA